MRDRTHNIFADAHTQRHIHAGTQAHTFLSIYFIIQSNMRKGHTITHSLTYTHTTKIRVQLIDYRYSSYLSSRTP